MRKDFALYENSHGADPFSRIEKSLETLVSTYGVVKDISVPIGATVSAGIHR
jgi:hypothetical protein